MVEPNAYHIINRRQWTRVTPGFTYGSGQTGPRLLVPVPFVDCAGEVKALFTSPQPGARLFALLTCIFPPHSAPRSSVTDGPDFGSDPRQWSSAQLECWVKQVDRDVAPDEVWVGPICCCILYRNELIWERIKDALGPPPELDPNDFKEDPYTVDTRDDQYPKGRAFVESCVATPPPNPDPEPQPMPDHVSESNSSASTREPLIISSLSIKPVLMTTSPVAEHDRPPPTRPGSHRMHDISEDVREESSENEDEEPAFSSPRRETIQRLCISTGPPPSGLFATGPNQAPSSMCAFSMSSVPQQQQSPQVPGEVPSPSMRSGSMGSMLMQRGWSYAASNASSEAYDGAGERGPGNPLFPTNFARLALGPTLTAKYISFFFCFRVVRDGWPC